MSEWNGLDTLVVAAGVSATLPLLPIAGVDVSRGMQGHRQIFTPASISAQNVTHVANVAKRAPHCIYIGPLVSTFPKRSKRLTQSSNPLHVRRDDSCACALGMRGAGADDGAWMSVGSASGFTDVCELPKFSALPLSSPLPVKTIHSLHRPISLPNFDYDASHSTHAGDISKFPMSATVDKMSLNGIHVEIRQCV
ncbi:hypothetical protein FISHEDRAFT_57769 [Fistulina hepatica ATCC 64428]|uniref:Uncharacterized protein n=1 Tax=Fistulina hepatica ATCC 64428 TaxID=1128425 RepID=A0A0D7AFG2_9AGAR|nr:hypothetical protein FISHEDRAFT_57769 [Fistulina hepatica ATCC 64428]